MSFKQYLKESLSLDNINKEELIDIMNRFRDEPLTYDFKERVIKINKVIESLNNIENVKGIPLLYLFIKILHRNGFEQDSIPILTLTKKYGSQILDVYMSSDEEAPSFLRKGVSL